VQGPRKRQIEKAQKTSGKSDETEVEPEVMRSIDVEKVKVTRSRVDNRHASLRRNLKEALSFTP
jgi:hypothetical protein